MNRHLFFLLLVLLLPGAGWAQVTLSGRVVSGESLQPLTGAHVTIDGTYRTAITDMQGRFRIHHLKPASYEIQVTHLGYASHTERIDIHADRHLEIQMKERVYLEEEVVVRATRAGHSSPTTYTTLEKKDISTINLGQDLPYLLEQSPSAVVSSDAGAGIGYTGIRIRGTDISRINVTINGIPLNDPESQNVFWVNMPDFSSSIESMQIQRGIGTSSNGGAAFGASINIQSQGITEAPYAEVNLGAGSFNSFKRNIRLGTGRLKQGFSVEARLSEITSDGFIERSASDLRSWFLSTAYQKKRHTTRLQIMSGTETTGQAWDGVPSSILPTNRRHNGIGMYTDDQGNTQYYDNETDNYRQDHYQLHHTYEIKKNLLLNAALFYIHGEGYYEQYKPMQKLPSYLLLPVVVGDSTINRTDLIRQKHLDNDFYGLTFSLQYDRKQTSVIAGGAWHSYRGLHFGEVIWAKHLSHLQPAHRWYENKGDKDEMNAYVKATHYLTPKISIFGDLQYRDIGYQIAGTHDDLRDLRQTHHHAFWSPKAGMQYLPDNRNTAYLSLAMTSREPSRSDYRDADPGRIPEPEHLINLESGYQYSTNGLMVAVNLYYMYYKHQLILTGEINDVGAPIMTNVPRSLRYGMEWQGKMQFHKAILWDANLSLSQSQIKDFTAFVDDWDTYTQVLYQLGTTPIAFSPAMVAHSNLTFKPIPQLELALISKYVGKQYIDNTGSDERKLDPYFVQNLRLAYHIEVPGLGDVRLSLIVNNLLNEAYETNAWIYRYLYTDPETGMKTSSYMDGYFPQAGRSFLAGIQIRI